jgi:hypothetical protein
MVGATDVGDVVVKGAVRLTADADADAVAEARDETPVVLDEPRLRLRRPSALRTLPERPRLVVVVRSS